MLVGVKHHFALASLLHDRYDLRLETAFTDRNSSTSLRLDSKSICIAMLFFGYQKLYTLFTFSILLLFMVYIEYVNKIRFMYRFYRAYLLMLIPFYLVYGVLTFMPVLQFNASETLKFNIFHIPFETPFYFMGMMLLSVFLFEVFIVLPPKKIVYVFQIISS